MGVIFFYNLTILFNFFPLVANLVFAKLVRGKNFPQCKISATLVAISLLVLDCSCSPSGPAYIGQVQRQLPGPICSVLTYDNNSRGVNAGFASFQPDPHFPVWYQTYSQGACMDLGRDISDLIWLWLTKFRMEWQAKQDRQGKIMQQLDVHIIEIGFYRFYSDLKVAKSHRTGFAILALL